MTSVPCPHCNDAEIQRDENDQLYCWKCGFRVTKEELEAMGIRPKEESVMGQGRATVKLTEEKIGAIRRLSDAGCSVKQIIEQTGASASSVRKYIKTDAGPGPGKIEKPAAPAEKKKVKPKANNGSGIERLDKEITDMRARVVDLETELDAYRHELSIFERARGMLG